MEISNLTFSHIERKQRLKPLLLPIMNKLIVYN